MTAASGKADSGAGCGPDGIDLDAQIAHAKGIYEGDCETFGKQSEWAIKSGSILASLLELRDRRAVVDGDSQALLRGKLRERIEILGGPFAHYTQRVNVELMEECIKFINSTAHLATPAANEPGEAVALKPEWWVKIKEVLARRFPVCRYCADENGVCPSSGLPCNLNDVIASTPQPGMVTVPREPTKDMLEEGFDAINKQYARDPLDDALERTQAVYRAMLDAALRSGGRETTEEKS